MTVREQLEHAVELAIDALNSFDRDPEAEEETDGEADHDGEEGAEGELWVQPANLSLVA